MSNDTIRTVKEFETLCDVVSTVIKLEKALKEGNKVTFNSKLLKRFYNRPEYHRLVRLDDDLFKRFMRIVVTAGINGLNL